MSVNFPHRRASVVHNAAPASKRRFGQRVKSIGRTVLHHLRRHTGVGIVCAVAYFDPGNWGVDLQAGSQYGYRLLFVVLLAGIFAVFLQVLASRLGCVTGLDLASHCRLLLHSRPKHTLLYRWLGLYPLYVLSEVAIIATDLAELLGSAIALCCLFPKLQLWHGVLITAFDVFLLLLFGDPLRGRPVRMFEFLIAGLVIAVLVCMVIIIAKIDVNWSDAFKGYVPSKYIFSSGALYTSVGILGATVMPHSLFIGSALATQDRISQSLAPVSNPIQRKESEDSLTTSPNIIFHGKGRLNRLLASLQKKFKAPFRTPPSSAHSTDVKTHSDRENRPYAFVKSHIYHGVVDIVISLLGFAVLINSLILILASAVFYYHEGQHESQSPASLFDAYDLIRDLVGQGAATLFAVALLASGQSSSIIATVAGQAVSEGFLQWRTSPAIRRIFTRLLAIIPSMAVAITVGRPGIDSLLVISQVILSIVLPFIMVPLIYCTSSKSIMSVRKPRERGHEHDHGDLPSEPLDTALRISSTTTTTTTTPNTPPGGEEAGIEMEIVDFSSGWFATGIGVAICLLVASANVFVLVSLGRGTQG